MLGEVNRVTLDYRFREETEHVLMMSVACSIIVSSLKMRSKWKEVERLGCRARKRANTERMNSNSCMVFTLRSIHVNIFCEFVVARNFYILIFF